MLEVNMSEGIFVFPRGRGVAWAVLQTVLSVISQLTSSNIFQIYFVIGSGGIAM